MLLVFLPESVSWHGYIAQWLERLTADQQVPGSNPGVPFPVFLISFMQIHAFCLEL